MTETDSRNYSWLFVVAHLAMWLPLAWVLNLWLDESWAMQTTAGGVWAAWHDAIFVERQAPLYFVLLAAWRGLNDSLIFARLLSAICGAVTILTIPALLRRFVPRASGFERNIVTAIVALHPFLLWASLEARGYGLVILLSALLLLLWFDGYAAAKTSRIVQFGYVLLAIAALYTNYYLGFLLFANFVALPAMKRRRAWLNYLAQMLIVAACFAPFVLIVKQQFARNTDYYHDSVNVLGAIRGVWYLGAYFALPTTNDDFWLAVRIWTLRVGLAMLLIWAIAGVKRLYRNFIEAEIVAPSIILLIVAAFLATATLLIGSAYVQPRHTAVWFVPSVLFIAAWLHLVCGKNALMLWLAILLIFSGILGWQTYAPLAKDGDWQRVARFVEQNESPNQIIAAFYVYDAVPFKYYYHGQNEVVPRRVDYDWNAEDAEDTRTRRAGQIEFLINQIPVDNQELWLITNENCTAATPAAECAPLEEFVQAHYVVERTENFYTRQVRLLRAK